METPESRSEPSPPRNPYYFSGAIALMGAFTVIALSLLMIALLQSDAYHHKSITDRIAIKKRLDKVEARLDAIDRPAIVLPPNGAKH